MSEEHARHEVQDHNLPTDAIGAILLLEDIRLYHQDRIEMDLVGTPSDDDTVTPHKIEHDATHLIPIPEGHIITAYFCVKTVESYKQKLDAHVIIRVGVNKKNISFKTQSPTTKNTCKFVVCVFSRPESSLIPQTSNPGVNVDRRCSQFNFRHVDNFPNTYIYIEAEKMLEELKMPNHPCNEVSSGSNRSSGILSGPYRMYRMCVKIKFNRPTDNRITFEVMRHTTYNYIDGRLKKKYREELSFTVEKLFELCTNEMCVCSQWHLHYVHQNGELGGKIPLEWTLGQVFSERLAQDDELAQYYLYLVADEKHVGIDVELYKDGTFFSTLCLTPTQCLRDLKKDIVQRLGVQDTPIFQHVKRIVEQGNNHDEATPIAEEARRIVQEARLISLNDEAKVILAAAKSIVEQDIVRNFLVKLRPKNGDKQELYPNSHTVAELNILQGQEIHFSCTANTNNARVCRLYLVPNYWFAMWRRISVQRNIDIEQLKRELVPLNIGSEDSLQLTIRTVTYCLSDCSDTKDKKILDPSHLGFLMSDEEILVEQVGEVQGIGEVEVIDTRKYRENTSSINVTFRHNIYTEMRVCDFKKSLLLTINDRWTRKRFIWLMRLYRVVGENEKELSDNDPLPYTHRAADNDPPPVTQFRLKFYTNTVMVLKKPYTPENNLVRPFGVDVDKTSSEVNDNLRIQDLIERFRKVDSTLPDNNDYKLEYREKDVTRFSQVLDEDLVMIVLKKPAQTSSGPSDPEREEESQAQSSQQDMDDDVPRLDDSPSLSQHPQHTDS